MTTKKVVLTKGQVESLLANKGVDKQIVSRSTLASVLNLSNRVIYNASKKGDLPEIDRGIYALNDICCWLISNPRYLKSLV